MNLIEKFCEALRRLSQVIGDEIYFHGRDAHARIVGVQSRKHEMEEPIGVSQMAAPGIQILVDQAERLVVPVDGKFEKALGLLLGAKWLIASMSVLLARGLEAGTKAGV